MNFLDLTGLSSFWTKVKAWADGKFTPNTRKINNKALSSDINLTAADVGAIPTNQKGTANGVASLDGSGKVPSAQLPSYVDDVLDGYLSGGKFYKEEAHTTELEAESGKIYTDVKTNKTYRWSGTAYVEISASLALGETASTAFAGDKGKAAYAHSQAAHARTDATKVEKSTTNGNIKINGTETQVYVHQGYTAKAAGLYKTTIDATGHVSGATPITKADITALGIPGQDTNTTYGNMTAATASAAGKAGLVPAPPAGSQNKFLAGDGTYKVPDIPSYAAITTAEIDALFQ